MRLAFLSVLLAGCAGQQLPFDLSKMTPEQLKAAAADRSTVASCTQGNGPWGTVRTVYVQIDKGSIPDGSVTVSQDCKVDVTPKTK